MCAQLPGICGLFRKLDLVRLAVETLNPKPPTSGLRRGLVEIAVSQKGGPQRPQEYVRDFLDYRCLFEEPLRESCMYDIL